MLPPVQHSLRTGAPQDSRRCSCKSNPSALSTHIRERQKECRQGGAKNTGAQEEPRLTRGSFRRCIWTIQQQCKRLQIARCWHLPGRIPTSRACWHKPSTETGRLWVQGQCGYSTTLSQKTSHPGLELSQPQRTCAAPEDQLVSSIHVVILSTACNSSSRGW